MLKKKQMAIVSRKSGSKVAHFARLGTMMFKPNRKTIRKTKSRVLELAQTVVNAILSELYNDSMHNPQVPVLFRLRVLLEGLF